MASRGIPTKYKGRLFRSRLEARWATFFDLLGWQYEYEPFDLDGWIPDFVLMGARNVLVEVKPILRFPAEVAEKINASGCDDAVLILGCSYPLPGPHIMVPFDNAFVLGWLTSGETMGHLIDHQDRDREDEWDWGWEIACMGQHHVGLHHSSLMICCYSDFIPIGDARNASKDKTTFYHSDIVRLWAEAGNRVQWMARQ